MKTNVHAYVDHCAIPVKDVEWHVAFFRVACGMNVREQRGPEENPEQVWMNGGIQLNKTSELPSKGGAFHIGIMAEDAQDVLQKSYSFDGVRNYDNREGWIVLPEGTIVEVIQALPGAIKAYCDVECR